MCEKFNWFNLPKQIKDKLNLALPKGWFDLPTVLNTYLQTLKEDKPTCYSQYFKPNEKITWSDLPSKLGKISCVQSCVEPSPFNFDITANWNLTSPPVTDAASFSAFFTNQGATSVDIQDFSLAAGRLQANITVEGLSALALVSTGVTQVNSVSGFDSSLVFLALNGNQITDFNPTQPLPNGLTSIELQNNQLTIFNPTTPLPSSLKNLILRSNQLTSFNPTNLLPSSLELLSLEYNQLTAFNPTNALPSSLETLELRANQLTAFNPTQPLPSSLTVLILDSNQITTSSWNTQTSWIALAPSNGVLYTTGNTDTVAGTATQTQLQAKGWIVNT